MHHYLALFSSPVHGRSDGLRSKGDQGLGFPDANLRDPAVGAGHERHHVLVSQGENNFQSEFMRDDGPDCSPGAPRAKPFFRRL
jgi:hypothetical protein